MSFVSDLDSLPTALTLPPSLCDGEKGKRRRHCTWVGGSRWPAAGPWMISDWAVVDDGASNTQGRSSHTQFLRKWLEHGGRRLSF